MVTITGTIYNDTLVGITSPTLDSNIGDTIEGLAGNDTITGLEAQDTLLGGDGYDVLYGNGGHDVLDGGNGNDRLFGGFGNDKLIGGSGDDYMDGGADFDVVDYSSATSGVTVNLGITTRQDTRGAGRDTIVNVEAVADSKFNDKITGNALDNQFYRQGGADIISGGDGNDLFYASFDPTGDRLSGGNGNDSLQGSYGNDTLNGGADNDRLTGSRGTDVLTGGSGADRFYFGGYNVETTDSTVAAPDTITDFNGAEDLIVLTGFAFTAKPTFILDLPFVNSGAGQLRVTGPAYAQLLEVDFNGDTIADMAIKVSGTALVADDFGTSFFA
jgi:Ca2+-binding RTX toxin-like protein